MAAIDPRILMQLINPAEDYDMASGEFVFPPSVEDNIKMKYARLTGNSFDFFILRKGLPADKSELDVVASHFLPPLIINGIIPMDESRGKYYNALWNLFKDPGPSLDNFTLLVKSINDKSAAYMTAVEGADTPYLKFDVDTLMEQISRRSVSINTLNITETDIKFYKTVSAIQLGLLVGVMHDYFITNNITKSLELITQVDFKDILLEKDLSGSLKDGIRALEKKGGVNQYVLGYKKKLLVYKYIIQDILAGASYDKGKVYSMFVDLGIVDESEKYA